MTIYEIHGINAENEDKRRKDYVHALKALHEEADKNINPENGIIRKRQIGQMRYDIKKGVLTVSIDDEINSFSLREALAENGLELKVL